MPARAAPVVAAVCAALTALLPPPTKAQTVRGVVTAPDTSIHLAGVSIRLLSTTGEVVAEGVTGSNGEFELAFPAAGTYLLEARAIGYNSRRLIVQPTETQVLTVQLERLPIQLDPLVVYGRTAGEREFESRRHLKWNFSYDWTQFANLGAHTVPDVIQYGLPGGRFACRPLVYFDGYPSRTFRFEDIPLNWVYGIEIYRTYYDIPLEYRDPFGDRRCGAVLIWTHPVGWTPVTLPDSAR